MTLTTIQIPIQTGQWLFDCFLRAGTEEMGGWAGIGGKKRAGGIYKERPKKRTQ